MYQAAFFQGQYCRIFLVLTLGLFPMVLLSQEKAPLPKEDVIIQKGPREIIKKAVIRKDDYVLTVQEVEAPSAVTKPELVVPSVLPVPEEEIVPVRSLFVEVTYFDEKAALMEWTIGKERFRAWSPVNFRHLGGMVNFEYEGVPYLLMCLSVKGEVPDGSIVGMSERDQLIVRGSTIDVLGDQPMLVSGSPLNKASMEFLNDLHHYYKANREKLAQRYEEKMATQLLNPPSAPSPEPKKNATVTYWKYHKPAPQKK